MIQERTNCRTCGSRSLKLILDLGKTPLANDFLAPEEVKDYSTSVPLRVVLCTNCSLVQLADTVDPKVLYSRYAYVTSNSKTMDAHLTAQRDHLLANGGLVLQNPHGDGKAPDPEVLLRNVQAKGRVRLREAGAPDLHRLAGEHRVPAHA